jgi:hypothetical protein
MNERNNSSANGRKLPWLANKRLWAIQTLLLFSTCAEPDYLEPPPTAPSSTQATGDAGGAAPAATPATTTPVATTAPETTVPVPVTPAPPPPPPPPPVDPKEACNNTGKFYDDISGGVIECTTMDALKPSECTESGLTTYFTSKLTPASQADLTSKKTPDSFEVATHKFDQCLICPVNSGAIACERQNPSAPQTAPMLKVFMLNKTNPTEGFWVELLHEVAP